MNDGILTMLIQWSFIWVIWMGSLDRPLQKFGMSRREALAVLTVFLICTFVSWPLYFLPVEVNLSGGIMPLLLAGWVYSTLPMERRRYLVVISFFIGFLFFFIRRLMFSDPVLLFWDEIFLFPITAVLTIITVARNPVIHLVVLLIAIPLSDAFFILGLSKNITDPQIGSDYAQDMLWTSISLWAGVVTVWHGIKTGVVSLCISLFPNWKWKSKTNSDR